MSSTREPQLGVAVGKRGIGKTYETVNNTIEGYLTGYGGQVKPRRVLILDVNDEFSQYKAIALSDVGKFSRHPTIEARRIRPFNPDGTKMTLRDIVDTLFEVLDKFKGGLLLIEDINKYLTVHLPKDVVGAICTNRHNDMDIIIHYQAIGKVPTTVWENVNWIRFHKNNQSVDRHEKKFEDRYEIVKIAECMVNTQYDNGNERFFVFIDLDYNVIRGKMTPQVKEFAVIQYMEENYKTVVKPEVESVDLDGQKKYSNPREAANKIKADLLTKYFE